MTALIQLVLSGNYMSLGPRLKAISIRETQMRGLALVTLPSGRRGRNARSRVRKAQPVMQVQFAQVQGCSKSDKEAGEEQNTTHLGGTLFRPFLDFAVQEVESRPDVTRLLLKEEFRNMVAKDGSATIENKAFSSSKIRFFRSTYINAGPSMQVLNVAGFPRPEYDLPIFCADFFCSSRMNIIVLDLNPLYNSESDELYKEKYFKDLIPLVNKYSEMLPWGDKLTAESLQFFSPLVLWTKAENQDLHKTLYPAFRDYLVAWLNLVDVARPTDDHVALNRNQEAQHRYISWRSTKDPGRPLLGRLFGMELSERYIDEYLFNGLLTLGTKSFLDYFPEYRADDGSIRKQRSMLGKAFSKRPWDKDGKFSPDQ